jgi:hypothetical protein
MKSRIALAIFATTALGAMLTQGAIATHPHPRGASPLHVSLVPAFKQCTSANRVHGAPLSFPSCAPPAPESNFLTVGTPDVNGAAANSVGSINLKVKTTDPAQVLISGTITDVRCRPGTDASVCNSPNVADGPDYSGQLQATALIRISDHQNGPSLTEAATVQDIPFPVSFHCLNTADTSIGGVCNIPTEQPLIPYPQATTPPRAVIEISQFQVYDGGSDGNVGTNDNTVFMRQGIFIP